VSKGSLNELATKKAEVDAQLVELPLITREVVAREADFRQKHVEFFNTVALQNVRDAMQLGVESQQDCKLRQDTINKGRECVLGPQDAVKTAIQINNNNAVSLEDLLRDL
jgi:hypothetical protein